MVSQSYSARVGYSCTQWSTSTLYRGETSTSTATEQHPSSVKGHDLKKVFRVVGVLVGQTIFFGGTPHTISGILVNFFLSRTISSLRPGGNLLEPRRARNLVCFGCMGYRPEQHSDQCWDLHFYQQGEKEMEHRKAI